MCLKNRGTGKDENTQKNYLPFVGRSTLFLCYILHLLAKTLKPRVLFVGGEFCFIFGEMKDRIRGEKGKQNYFKKQSVRKHIASKSKMLSALNH